MQTRAQFLQLAAGGTVALLGLSACTGAPQAQAEPEKTYVFVCPFIRADYWEDFMEGVRVADSEIGCKTLEYGPDTPEDYADRMPPFLQDAVDERPDGILCYAGIEALYPILEDAGKKGIPVVAVDSDCPKSLRAAYVGIDSYNAGFASGEAIVSRVKGPAVAASLVTSLASQHEKEVHLGMNDALADHGVDMAYMLETDNSEEDARRKIVDLLTEHPEIKVVFTTGSVNGTGAAQAKKELGSGVLLVCFDDIEDNLEFLREGVIDALMVQSPRKMGYLGVKVLDEVIEKGAASQDFYDTGVITVTLDNIDTYKDAT